MSTQAERFKELRNALGMTQKTMAEALNITPGAVSHIELGRVELSPRNIGILTESFHVNRIWLTEGIGEMFSEDETPDAQIARKMITMTDTQKEIVSMLMDAPEEVWEAAGKILDWIQEGGLKR